VAQARESSVLRIAPAKFRVVNTRCTCVLLLPTPYFAGALPSASDSESYSLRRLPLNTDFFYSPPHTRCPPSREGVASATSARWVVASPILPCRLHAPAYKERASWQFAVSVLSVQKVLSGSEKEGSALIHWPPPCCTIGTGQYLEDC